MFLFRGGDHSALLLLTSKTALYCSLTPATKIPLEQIVDDDIDLRQP
jgi:hypothetical protein